MRACTSAYVHADSHTSCTRRMLVWKRVVQSRPALSRAKLHQIDNMVEDRMEQLVQLESQKRPGLTLHFEIVKSLGG